MNIAKQQQILFSCFLLFLSLRCSTSTDTITPNTPMEDDGQVLVSVGEEAFALGFFSPANSTQRYVGIWYNKVSEHTVVWVANRDNPITDTSGILSIDITGNLALHDRLRNLTLWSTNISAMVVSNGSSAQLMDTGNLVLFSRRVSAWESFDHPTNTMLPYMKFGVDRRTGLNRFLTSWKSNEDPGSGEYSFKMDLNGSPQAFLYKGSNKVLLWRTGPWNGLRWSGVPEMTPNFIFNISYLDNVDEVSIMYSIHNASIFSRLVMNESGMVDRLTWHEMEHQWVRFWSVPKDQCDNYNHCGWFGYCDPYNAGEFECKCLPGFEPKLTREWYLREGSGGCVRKRGGHVCGNGEGFVKVERVKIPDTSMARVDTSLGLQGCEELCLKNCSCTGYSSADVSSSNGGSGCITWFGELIDTRQFSDVGQDLYLRVDAVELAQYSKKSKSFHGKMLVTIVIVSIAAMLLLLCLVCRLVMKRRTSRRGRQKLLASFTASPISYEGSSRGKKMDESGTNADLRIFDLRAIVAATNNFSLDNKLGEGGFGAVYKGQLSNGEEIAVKRLSKTSGQGVEEFKNEVTLIARLQHRNLVRLLGCCVQQEEKMLVYEYLPNKGLDFFIFDKAKGSLMDWRKRFEIILGIARGMIYLHQDSRLRIIHRDLKASNVLLDSALNPKISDFGMAKIFGGDQVEANTNRVVGTYGYMSPEYAMEGLFSIKSDVFSFGVLLLEIISGRKNNSYYKENSVNLIGHVWDLWREGKGLDTVDSSLGDSYEGDEVLRCIHIGLLCVQEYSNDRPTMSQVAFMLCNQTALSSPKQPAFIFRRANKGPDSSSSASVGPNSVNEITLSTVEAR